MSPTPILSWREAEFVAAYGSKAGDRFARGRRSNGRSWPSSLPHLLPLEREFLDKNQFKVAFQPFDWRLNDLTGGRIE